MKIDFSDLNVLGLGDNTVDIYIDKDIYYPGGNCVNFSVFAKRLGAQSSYIGVLGNDEKGKHLLCSLEKEKVNVERVIIKDAHNSYAKVNHINNNRVFVNSDPCLSKSLISYIKNIQLSNDIDIIHTSIFSNLECMIKFISRKNIKISYDFSDKYFKFNIDKNEILPYLDYGFFSFENFNEDNIFKFIKEIEEEYDIEVIVTAGKEGSFAIEDGENIHVFAKDISPVDTIGAGDAYITKYLLARLKGVQKQDAMKMGGEYASKACMIEGSFGYGKKL